MENLRGFGPAVALLLGASACSACGTGGRETATAAPITLHDVSNLAYDGIYEEPVRLTDGRWEGRPFVAGGAARPSVWLIDRAWLQGDLDGDGDDEAVVLLGESSGGSGSYLFVAAVGRRDGRLVNLGTARVGDRVQVRALRRDGDRIELDVVQAGPDDPACCPTQKATRSWRLGPDGLAELPPVIDGALSIADLEGVEWTLTHLTWSEAAPDEPAVTLTVEDGRIGGAAGCNRYFGAIEESSPGQISIGALGSTKMACGSNAMQIETRYLTALASVLSYSFLGGQLALTYTSGDSVFILLFEPRSPA